MTGTDVMESCWHLLQDKEDPHVLYPGQEQVKWINEAVVQITQERPDSLIATGGLSIRTITPIVDLDSTLSLTDRWKTAVIEWVLSRAFQTDAEDEGDKKQADRHSKLFNEAIGR